MSLTIRQRCRAVAQCIYDQGIQGIARIAALTGLSKSSVHRHQQAIARRNQYPESLWWETQTGSFWLKLLVLGVVYYFGIKHGLGGESLSEFFSAIRLNHHVGTSASSIRKLKEQMRQSIAAYEVAMGANCQVPPETGICVGGDETFFGLPILVMVELASGYIFTEVECEDRTYETWSAQLQRWLSRSKWRCHFMVSDGAKALIKLAVEGLGCPSVADVFHVMRALAQPFGSAIGRQVSQLNKKAQTLNEQLLKVRSDEKREQLQHAIDELSAEQRTLKQQQSSYHQALHQITQTLHPFAPSTLDWQGFEAICEGLKAPLETLSKLSQSYGGQKATKAIETFEKQLPSIAQGIHAWWKWVSEALSCKSDDPQVQNWVLSVLLPWVYWHQQAEKTRRGQLKADYVEAAQRAQTQMLEHPLTQMMGQPQLQEWIEWAQWMANKYQRTSSAVEGRNGYLSALHHNGRGIDEKTLKALTIIHNFDLKRADGTTAAQRLFGHPFPDLFEWVVENMGELPVARRSSKAQKANPLTLAIFPA